MTRAKVTSLRVRNCNDAPVRSDARFVLYWMTATRRAHWNFALDRAAEHARRLGKPLVVLEALRCDYPWASDRMHAFVIDGMRDNRRAFARTPFSYHPYVEPTTGAGRGLLLALAADACLVVTDEYPCFFLPRMIATAAERVGVRMEAVDSLGLMPLSLPTKSYLRAHDFRRFLQRELPSHLGSAPRASHSRTVLPILPRLPEAITRRWPAADLDRLREPDGLAALPIDHEVRPTSLRGGARAGRQALGEFVGERLGSYGLCSRDPMVENTSGLSPWLHFGHVSAHEILAAVTKKEGWQPSQASMHIHGKREGWWGMSRTAEVFLDELVTWRELCHHTCWQRPDYDRYESLPGWARETLGEHASDPRPYLYDLEQFEQASTHDEIWNACQQQLRKQGRIHSYLRMLWGKKVLHWSPSPRHALETMIQLNNKYSLDGRDPNSYGGIFWTLGRHDRAWGPIRPVFGKIRYMSSESTRSKMRMAGYVRHWTGEVEEP